ncbi:porphobilinogen deaminase [Amylostereum chailletii]|nr:porphobilinogen deaminase [Amylostereum chailletii]
MASTDPAASIDPAASTAKRSFVLASRASELAQIQTNLVRAALERTYPTLDFSTQFMSTQGDKNQSQALYLLGGKSLWTKELEVALKEGEVDMLVHCVKDMPTALPDGCVLGAILEREDPVDSLVVKQGLEVDGRPVTCLDDLKAGAVIGTSSVRRVAQLKRNYPHLVFQDVRGNLNTRMRKLDDPAGPYAALVLAKAGMVRLGFGARLTADLPPPTLFYAVGQGALGVEIRANDAATARLCAGLTHWPTQWTCLAERACLRVLEGGCSVPVGVSATFEVVRDAGAEDRQATLGLTGTITSLDGATHVQHALSETVSSVAEAEAVGVRLARVLVENGGKEILKFIVKDRLARGEASKSAEDAKNETGAAQTSA